MKKRSKAWISSGTFGKAFLMKAWEARGELLDYERRGFAQYFYLTLCGHVESVLVNRIKARLNLITMTHWENVGPLHCKIEEREHAFSIEPVVSSIRHIAAGMEREIESAALSNLIRLYNEIFPENLNAVIGAELAKDLEALAKLRNIFAHGRDIFMEFEPKGDDMMDLRGTLDDNPLKFPAQRLQAAGIITSFEITGQNHHEFTAIFFSDNAMLHFYRVVQEAETKIKNCASYPPDKMWFGTPDLPDLKE